MNLTTGLFFLTITMLSCVPFYQSNNTPPHQSAPPLEENSEATPSAQATAMLNAVNKLRRSGCKCGSKNMPAVPPLSWNSLLEKAAAVHAEDMRRNDFFDHKGSDRSTVGKRAKKAGYQWSYIAENIAKGPTTVQTVVSGWKNSPGHCENMMSSNYKELGAASSEDLWVQVFGKKQ